MILHMHKYNILKLYLNALQLCKFNLHKGLFKHKMYFLIKILFKMWKLELPDNHLMVLKMIFCFMKNTMNIN